MERGPFDYTLKHPIELPDRTIERLEFPRMKGKFMRKFQAKATQAQANAAAAGEATVAMEYEQFMAMGEQMLADKYGAVSARLIFDEMDPEDVHEVVGLVGERFAPGLETGAKG
jgi:hypothetical protein